MSDSGDKTEAPTPRRLQRAREEGNVPISREVAGLAGLGAGVLVLSTTIGSSGRHLVGVLRNLVAEGWQIDVSQGGRQLLAAVGGPVRSFLLPIMAASVLATIAATLVQTGFVLNTKALMPDLSRLSPARGLKRVLGPTNLVETAKSLVKLAAFGFVVRHLLANTVVNLAQAGTWSIGLIGRRLSSLLLTCVLTLLAVQLVIAAIDVGWVRFNRTRNLRMSRQDQRDEQKETDGNPQVKARLRALRRARARQRMMQAVPTAAVVLTNPTHFAVALSYDQGSKQAPRIVAKGADEVAERIRALARQHRVPLVANPPLTRILFQVPIDQEVPREQFQAVAAVIAYVWRLNEASKARGLPLNPTKASRP